MKNTMSACTVLLIGYLVVPTLFAGTYGGGTGTAADPYQIWKSEQMNNIGANSGDWNKCFILMADLDMSVYTGTLYKIIGDFRGTFDGNGHAIRNLSYSSAAARTNVGLFGSATTATIKNLGLENVNLSVSGQFVGGLAGQLNNCMVTKCYSVGTITDSYSANELYVGVLVGYQNNGAITDCYSAGSVVATMSSTSFYWSTYAGGLVGQQSIGSITNCHSHASVIATSLTEKAYAGGLVGYQPVSICNIVNSYSTGDVSAVNSPKVYAGGLVGYRSAMNNSLTNGCCSTGTVTASSSSNFAYAGGLIGYLSAPISNCYSTGTVHCSGRYTYTGGLAGYATYATLGQCYSAGLLYVSAATTAYTGGSIGYREQTSALACFWDTTASDQVNASGYADSTSGIFGKTTPEMRTHLTFTTAGWDFENMWDICEGTNYPRLQLQIPVGDFVCPNGVGVEDLSILVLNWLRVDCGESNQFCGGADMNVSGAVDWVDFAAFAGHWMEGN
jgi:hypothetical protein